MRPVSPTQLCMSVNVCKQTSPEIPEVTCTIMDFFARDASDMGYQPGGEIMASVLSDFLHEMPLIWVISLEVKLWLVYFRSLHMQKLSY